MKSTSWLLFLPAFLLTLFAAPNAQAQARRGWSPQAKGAVIGGAAGVLGGALINGRNRKVGALIGGVGGAAAGYGVGSIIKSKKKKAAALAAERAAANERIAAANARAAAAERNAVAARQAAESRTASSTGFGAARPVATAATAAAATTALVAANTEPTVADGYLPNPQYGVPGTPYPNSRVLRKSW
jgi:hypothetical protein